MDTSTYIYISIGLIIVLAVIAFFLIRRIRRNKKRVNLIPPEVLADFNEAQRRYAEFNGTKSPSEILWEMQKEKSPTLRANLNSNEQMEGGIQQYGTRQTERADSRAVEANSNPVVPRTGNAQAVRSYVRRESIPTEPAPKADSPKRYIKKSWADFS